jgi:hypothetical protein
VQAGGGDADEDDGVLEGGRIDSRHCRSAGRPPDERIAEQ